VIRPSEEQGNFWLRQNTPFPYYYQKKKRKQKKQKEEKAEADKEKEKVNIERILQKCKEKLQQLPERAIIMIVHGWATGAPPESAVGGWVVRIL
jgi:hypothetical protein